MKVAVFAAGQLDDYDRVRVLIGTPDLVLCADRGAAHALNMGLMPDMVLGDFDSASAELVAELESKGIPLQRVPAAKDETDTHLALNEAIGRGATEIVLVGGTGDRLDHTLSNLMLLPGLPANVPVVIVDAKNVIRLLRPGGRLTITGRPGDLLSLLPLSPAVKGVVAEGVRWPLDGAILRWGESLGVSNQLAENEAFVAVREGYLLVISAQD